jgi:DNA repair protein RadA/Sms
MLSLAWRVSHVMISAASRRRIISPGTPASVRRFRAMQPAFSDAAIGRPARPGALRGRGRAWCVTVRGARGAAGSKAPKQRYLCQDCGEDYGQWHGQCPGCKAWESFTIFTVEPAGGSAGKGGGGAGARALAKAAADAPSIGASLGGVTGFGGLNDTDSSPGVSSSAQQRQQRRQSIGGVARGASRASRGGWVQDAGAPRRLSDVLSPGAAAQRLPRVGLPGALGAEVERVLGGGVVPGAMLLIGGDPGVGKSTLALQVAGLLGEKARLSESKTIRSNAPEEDAEASGAGAGAGASVLYASGEESVEQLASRAERLGVNAEGVMVYSATRLEAILAAVVRERPAALVVDSIQTVFLEDATGSPGSTSQVRECATALLHAAKTAGMPVFIIGHVTKSGDIAGPRVLEHIVDVVLYMEGDADRAVRVLRGHKNRYGSVDEVGVFEMADSGLKPVPSPSALFMGERVLTADVSSAPTVTVQGSRPFMLEVQALCSERYSPEQGAPPTPAVRTAVGFKPERLQLLLAVLAKFCLSARLHQHDVFVNIVGGMKLEDPSTDVAVALAIASSFAERPLPADMAFFGEVGLGGELRPVAQSERRLAEAATMGFKRVIMPRSSASPELGKKQGVEVVLCATLADAIREALGVEPKRRAARGADGSARRGRGAAR